MKSYRHKFGEFSFEIVPAEFHVKHNVAANIEVKIDEIIDKYLILQGIKYETRKNGRYLS